MNVEDIQNMTDEEIKGLVGGIIYSNVRALVDQGMSAQMALRIVAAEYVTQAMGPKALEDMGVPFSTARRWRLQLRRAVENVPDELPQTVLEDVQRYLEQQQKG
jgi:hypothetical protein